MTGTYFCFSFRIECHYLSHIKFGICYEPFIIYRGTPITQLLVLRLRNFLAGDMSVEVCGVESAGGGIVINSEF